MPVRMAVYGVEASVEDRRILTPLTLLAVALERRGSLPRELAVVATPRTERGALRFFTLLGPRAARERLPGGLVSEALQRTVKPLTGGGPDAAGGGVGFAGPGGSGPARPGAGG